MNMATQPGARGDDTSIEAEIVAKGKTAARVTPADVEAVIIAEHYFTAADGVDGGIVAGYKYPGPLDLLTFCVLVLRNGFTVTGESACASPENFDSEIGRKIARQNAVAKVWPLLGYELRTALSRPVLTDGDALADLNGTPRPDAPSRGDA
nr:Gp49 family protein [Burkholderia ubonensis]